MTSFVLFLRYYFNRGSFTDNLLKLITDKVIKRINLSSDETFCPETTLKTSEDENTLKTSEDETTLKTSEDETTLKTSEESNYTQNE